MTTEVEGRNQRYYAMAKYSGMPPDTGQSCTLTQFLPGKGNQEAYNAALRYVSKKGHHFITFVGEVGRGKTHLALGIGWQWIGQGKGTVKYWQVEKSTEWAVDKLDTLINHRWLLEKPTVFTTNLAPAQLSPRVSSRIREGVTVTLEGYDYREYKAKLRKESNRE